MVESTAKKNKITFYSFIRHGERADAVAMTEDNKPPYDN